MPESKSRAQVVALVLARIADGCLPNIEIRQVWAGWGGGRTCNGCEQPITTTEIEDEVELGGAVVLRLHRRCFTIWQEALEKPAREIRGGGGLRAWPPL